MIKARLLKQIKKLEHGNRRHRRWLRSKGAKILLRFIYDMRYEARSKKTQRQRDNDSPMIPSFMRHT